jgi:hypothetical protein
MARRKSIGESGSPCLTPWQCKILLPDSPLRMIEEEEVSHKEEI